ncbi:nacht and wd40 domain containing protein [Grosmannia clavigera kw1407]|uniref:Nacht and wd40 domain containing protein n=1 Tax=Grosmannia clavigera (strain kw1407 / UAMH 11150) TaxID=655863 RepID=F0XPC4_GROCL|nr:nacht and wd40 domain containing protein [Grosmannia clavigera kw1407]EFX00600.1 nacht and wd40 domain containing protein [Grosmannia clavigera kw1407]
MEAKLSGRKRKWLREKLHKGRGKNGYDRDVSSSRNASKVSVIVDVQSAPEASSKQDTEPPSTLFKTTDEHMDQPTVTDISSELWTRAYDRLKSGEETATLVEAYEGVLFGIIRNDTDLDDSEEGKEKDSVSISTTTPNDAEKINNPLQTSGGSGRIDIMEQATRVALARAKKHKSVHEAVKDTAEFIKEIESTVSSMLTAYPPAAMAWSGICMILPILASPSVQRLEMCVGLEHVMDKLEWYMALARVAFRSNWNADPASAQMLELTKNKVVELYAALLEYEMQCVCECFKTSRFVRSMRVLLTIDDWKERIQTVKDKETEIKDQLKQHKMVQNTDTLDHISKDTSKYDAWLNSVPDRIEGTYAGCGKSVLSRYLVKTVLPDRLLESGDNAVIAYFFFSEGAETSLARALCAIVHQLLCSCEKLVDLVEGDISKAGEALIGNWSRLWDIFQKYVRTLIGNFQTLVESLSTNKKGSLKVVMTTRGYPGIVERFRFRQDSSSIRLAGENSEEIAQIQDEIAIVINHKLDKLAEAKNLKTERVNKLRSLLANQGGNQRTYLWVHLIFAVLENNNRNVETEWARRINTLPDTVNEAYEKLLGAIPDDDRARVRNLLHLMFVAYIPLTLVDAAVLMNARETYEASTDNPEQEIGVLEVESADSFCGWVLSTCHCFVTVYGNTL